MKITKSWFYQTSEINYDNIIINDNISITIFDDVEYDINIIIWENSNVEFFGFCEKDISKIINIKQNNNNSKIHFRYLIYSNKIDETNIKILSNISWTNNSSDIKILSIIWENWNINLDWILKIEKNSKWIKWKLIEDNLFLWNKWKIRWIPTLLVESDDVEASHACKMERVSDEKLFYMRSRWIWKESAISMMINAKVFDLFKCLSMINKDFYDKFLNNILNKIN